MLIGAVCRDSDKTSLTHISRRNARSRIKFIVALTVFKKKIVGIRIRVNVMEMFCFVWRAGNYPLHQDLQ